MPPEERGLAVTAEHTHQEGVALMNTDTNSALTAVGEADLIEQCLDVVDHHEPDLDEVAPQVAGAWDGAEADRVDQVLAVPLDDDERYGC